MCGVAGWVAFDRDLTLERDVIDATAESMPAVAPTPVASRWHRMLPSAIAGWP